MHGPDGEHDASAVAEFWFTCPSCREMKTIDEDQAEGRVSIQCDCGFHETGKVRPLIPSTVATRPEDAPSSLI